MTLGEFRRATDGMPDDAYMAIMDTNDPACDTYLPIDGVNVNKHAEVVNLEARL